MKILSLNTHSLEEKDMPVKQNQFIQAIIKEQPDLIALQEVNQNFNSPVYAGTVSNLKVLSDNIPLREDNHALALALMMEQTGLDYEGVWLPIKVGYDRYDEGVAIFSKKPILDTNNVLVSSIDAYQDYRTRRLLGVKTEDGWFYSIHMNWWNDPYDPFKEQFMRLTKAVEGKSPVYLLGDFNGDAAIRNETYDYIADAGWKDTFTHAASHDEGWTVSGMIDGWRDQKPAENRRIDFIWTNDTCPVLSSNVLFNGINQPVISDHFGIVVEMDK